MGKKAATAISWLFHPLLVSNLVLVLLFRLDPGMWHALPPKVLASILAMAFGITLAIPAGLTWLMYRFRIIRSIYMPGREERMFPLLVTGIFYYATYYLFRGMHLPMLYSAYMLAVTSLCILLIVANLFFKVSLHMAGMGATAGMFTGLALHYHLNLTWLIAALILLAGVTGMARLKLFTHHPAELYAGWVMGAAVMFLTGMYF
jgi:hypothetical protein